MIALAVKKNKTRKRYSQMAGADGVARLCAAGALLKKAKQGLSFERWCLCPAGGGVGVCAAGALKKVKQGLSVER